MLGLQRDVNYAFRRNLWGLRIWGLSISALSLVALAAGRVIMRCDADFEIQVISSSVLSAVFLLLWIFRFTPDWVRVAAMAYAQRLIEATKVK